MKILKWFVEFSQNRKEMKNICNDLSVNLNKLDDIFKRHPELEAQIIESMNIESITARQNIFIVKSGRLTDYKVCFVISDSKQINQDIITGGRLVKNEKDADIKISIVKNIDQADILITYKNFPKSN